MATVTDQEIELLINATVTDLASVSSLIEEIRTLGYDTSAANEQLAALAVRFQELKDQQGLIDQLSLLTSNVRELAIAQAEAKLQATELGRALAAATEPNALLRAEFELARSAAKETEKAWQSSQVKLQQLQSVMAETGLSTNELAAEQTLVRQAFADLGTKLGELKTKFSQVGKETDQFDESAQTASSSLSDLSDEADSSSSFISKLGGGFKSFVDGARSLVAGTITSIATLGKFSRAQGELAKELTESANALGMNREALQVWKLAGDRVGLSGEQMTGILQTATSKLREFATTGGGEAAGALESLNLKVSDFQNLKPEDQMLRFAEAIESLPASEQTDLLEALASDAGRLQPLLANNASGLKNVAKEASEVGAIYSDAELDKLQRSNEVYDKIDVQLQGLTRRVGAELAPAFSNATEKVLGLFNQSDAGDKLVALLKSLIGWGEEVAVSLLSNIESMSSGFGTLWSTVKAGASGTLAAFRGIQTVVAGFLTVLSAGFAGWLSTVEGLAFLLNKVGAISDETYNGISAKADAARRTTADLAEQTAEYGRQALEAGKGVVDAFEPAGQQLENTATQAKKTGEAIKEIGEETGKTATESDKAETKATELANAYNYLGLTSQKALNDAADKAKTSFEEISNSGEATQRKIAESFMAYAKAVIATGDEARMRALEGSAATLGLQQQFQSLQTEQSGAADEVKDGFDQASESIKKAGEETDKTKDKTKSLQTEQSGVADEVKDGFDQASESIKKAGEETDKTKDKTKESAEAAAEARQKFREAWGAAFAKAITNAREKVTALSAAARNLFELKIGGNAFVSESESASEALARAEQRTSELAAARRRLTSSSFGAWFADTALAAAEVEEKFWRQAVAVENLTAKVNQGVYSLDDLNYLSETAANRFDVLDSQRLNGLQSAIESARNRLDSLNSSADSTLNSMRQRLASIRGDAEEEQRLQFEAERDRLLAQLNEARAAGADTAAASYREALETLEKINALETRNRIEEEKRERERKAAENDRDNLSPQRQPPSRREDDRESARPATQPVRTINVRVGKETFQAREEDEAAVLRALETSRSTYQ